MPIPVPTYTDLAELLLAVKTQITTAGVVTVPACYITLTPDVVNLPIGDYMAAIVPRHQAVNQPVETGAGNELLWIDGQFEVSVWCRLNLDRQGQNDDLLTSPSLGLIAKYTCLINALSQFVPVNSHGDFIVNEPIRLVSADFRGTPDSVGRVAVTTAWEVSYHQRVSCS